MIHINLSKKASGMDDHYAEAEYNNYWETMKYYDELDSWGFDETLSCHNTLHSPEKSLDVATNSSAVPAQETIDTENRRRRKMNESLYALRSVVPCISKMDKASIVKDAIDHVQELQKEEKSLIADIAKLEYAKQKQPIIQAQNDSVLPVTRSPVRPFIEIKELRVCDVGNKTLVVSMNCTKKRDTVFNLCKLFHSLNLNVLSFNMTSICGNVLHTQIVEADDMNSTQLKEMIEAAIADCEVKAAVN